MTAPWLDRDLTTLAFLWRLDRADGVSLGFTSHDRDLTVGGFAYRASPGMLPSAITITDGLDADTLDVAGALTADAITAADLAAGRWDGASVRLLACNWEQPEAGTIPLARGTLGDVGIRDGAFTAELSGPAAVLSVPAIEATAPECRAELGDRRCRVGMAGRVRKARVIAQAGATLTLDTAEPHANAYGYGRLRVLDRPNSGIAFAILRSEGASVVLRRPPPAPLLPGTAVELAEGCDKSFGTCRARFANAANFRGEPHLPGQDLLTRYPGA